MSEPRAVLCFGDSNTWGWRPDSGQRFGHTVRWPRVLQTLLGDNYYVVEEGLCARTTDLDDKDGHIRNGLAYLPACVKSHRPLDVVIIMLGTNDLKDRFNRQAKDIAEAVGRLIDAARYYADNPSLNIVIVSPPVPDSTAPEYEAMTCGSFAMAQPKARQLPIELQKIAARHGVIFFDSATCTQVGVDGLHMDADSHTQLATALSDHIKQLGREEPILESSSFRT